MLHKTYIDDIKKLKLNFQKNKIRIMEDRYKVERNFKKLINNFQNQKKLLKKNIIETSFKLIMIIYLY